MPCGIVIKLSDGVFFNFDDDNNLRFNLARFSSSSSPFVDIGVATSSLETLMLGSIVQVEQKLLVVTPSPSWLP